jgi:hypothetical protein
MSFFWPLSPLNETRVTTYESSGVFGLLLGEVVWRKQHPQAFDFKRLEWKSLLGVGAT